MWVITIKGMLMLKQMHIVFKKKLQSDYLKAKKIELFLS